MWKGGEVVALYHYIDDIMLTGHDLVILYKVSERLLEHLEGRGWVVN